MNTNLTELGHILTNFIYMTIIDLSLEEYSSTFYFKEARGKVEYHLPHELIFTLVTNQQLQHAAGSVCAVRLSVKRFECFAT
jgi:hypothetical protein